MFKKYSITLILLYICVCVFTACVCVVCVCLLPVCALCVCVSFSEFINHVHQPFLFFCRFSSFNVLFFADSLRSMSYRTSRYIHMSCILSWEVAFSLSHLYFYK
eukprot:GHVR01015951.1.p1 GENE.GHVR01015951.1~~GHVR01015951.1.p1  ORF type:complete len:104 (-),score=12.30 GHVR01015951.1:60-371(-)